jgi:integrase
MAGIKRGVTFRVEDRWHRDPRQGETVAWPADDNGQSVWCVDPQHAQQPGTLVTTAKHGKGMRWMARWVDAQGVERAKSFQRKAAAEAHVNGVSAAVTTGTYADPKRAAVKFAIIAEEWFVAKQTRIAPKTAAGYRSLLDVLVLPKWGESRLSDIDHSAVQSWVSWLVTDPAARHRPQQKPAKDGDSPLTGLSPARVIQAFQIVDQVLTYAVRTKYLAVNPVDHVELPRKTPAERIALSHAEVRELAESAGDLATMVYVLGYSGIRYGECSALTVGEFDAQRSRLRVARSVTYVTGSGRVEGGTKTHRSRTVPLPAFVTERLKAETEGRGKDERLFPAEDGGPMPLDYFRWRFDKAAVKAGLTGVTPKTLRHTAGSLALASGSSVIVAQKLLGHRSATTTMDVYSHMLPDDFDNLAAKMDAAARAAVKGLAGHP